MKIQVLEKMALLLVFFCVGPACEGSNDKPIIKMGIVLPLTGTFAIMGNPHLLGMNLAVQHFRADTGLTVEVPDPFDDKTEIDSNSAKEGVEKLVDEDEVVVVIGGYSTASVTAGAEAAEKRGVPFTTAGAVSQSLTERQFDHFFRLTPVGGYAKGQAELAKEVFEDVTKIAVLYVETPDNTDWGASIMTELAANTAVEVVLEEKYPTTVTDIEGYKELIQKAKDAEAEVIFAASGSYSGMVKAAAEVWPSSEDEPDTNLKAFVGTFGLASQAFLAAAGQHGNLAYGTSPWQPGSAPEQAKDMEQRLMEDFEVDNDAPPMYLNVLGYCEALLALEACKRVIDAGKDLTPQNVSAELRNTDRMLPIGLVKFDEYGDSMYYVARIVQVQNGVFEVVYPLDVKTTDAVFPGVGW